MSIRGHWTAELLGELHALLAQGLSQAECAVAMGGLTVPQISGAVRHHQLNRLSFLENGPIWFGDRLDELMRLVNQEPRPSYTQLAKHFPGCTKNAIAGAIYRNGLKRQAPAAPVVIEFPYSGCLWPFGHPGEPKFHFCGATSIRGKAYCPTHCATAYGVSA